MIIVDISTCILWHITLVSGYMRLCSHSPSVQPTVTRHPFDPNSELVSQAKGCVLPSMRLVICLSFF